MDGTTLFLGHFGMGRFLHLGRFRMGRFCMWAVLGWAVFVWDDLVSGPTSPESIATDSLEFYNNLQSLFFPGKLTV